MKKTIKVDLFIEYDEEKKGLTYCNIGGEYNLTELAVIMSAFKKYLNDWGYEVKRIEE